MPHPNGSTATIVATYFGTDVDDLYRVYAAGETASWRSIARLTMDIIKAQAELPEDKRMTNMLIRQNAGTLTGNSERTVDQYVRFESRFGDMLDELPAGLNVSISNLRDITTQANDGGLDYSIVLSAWVDEAIANGGTFKSPDKCAAERANGEEKEPPALASARRVNAGASTLLKRVSREPQMGKRIIESVQALAQEAERIEAMIEKKFGVEQ